MQAYLEEQRKIRDRAEEVAKARRRERVKLAKEKAEKVASERERSPCVL